MGKLMVFDNGGHQKENNISVLLPGKEFSAKIKSLANGSDLEWNYVDKKIKNINILVSSSVLENDDNSIVVSTPESDCLAKASFDNGTIIIATSADKIYLNENSERLFCLYSVLASLDLSNVDTSNVVNMSNMFAGLTSLSSLNLSGMDTSNVENMDSMFGTLAYSSHMSILDIGGFDFSKVGILNSMVRGAKIKTLRIDFAGTIKEDANMTDMFKDFNKGYSFTVECPDTTWGIIKNPITGMDLEMARHITKSS